MIAYFTRIYLRTWTCISRQVLMEIMWPERGAKTPICPSLSLGTIYGNSSFIIHGTILTESLAYLVTKISDL